MTTAEIAHVFKDGDAVTVRAEATKRNGDKLPQAGKAGVIINVPSEGRYMVDVPGMPVVNLPADDLEPRAGTPSSAAPAAAKDAPPYAFDQLELAAIVPSLTNPRTYFDPEALQSLANSISTDGLGQPILVRPLPGSRLQETFADRRKGDPRPTHEIIAGERRFRACKLAGVRTVPVMIRAFDDERVLRMQLLENVQREGLHPLEEAHGYRRILDLPRYAEQPVATRIEALAGEVKKSPRYIYVTLQLLKLCDFTQKIFQQPEFNLHRSVAKEIATIGNEAQQIEATKRICGLVPDGKGWKVGDNPMSAREAAGYVRDNFRLLLSKAPFPVKVEYAGVAACSGCDKMSANAGALFDEGVKVPDTCMDPSCYGKKNAEHTKQLATAAKAEGQKVITGKAAEKHIPYEDQPDYLSHSSEYQSLDERLYSEVIDKLSGKTVRQILGKDIPKPTLIERPDGRGFTEALLRKDVARLLQERGLARVHISGAKSAAEKNKEAKQKAEKAWRAQMADLLLLSAGTHNHDELRAQLLLSMMVRIYVRLENEASKKVRALMGWEIDRGHWSHGGAEKLMEHFRQLDGLQINQFVVAACIADDLSTPLWQTVEGKASSIEYMAQLLEVDGKALRATMEAEAKAAEKEKAAKKKSAGKKAPAKKAPADKPTATDGAAIAPAVGCRVKIKEGLRSGPGGKFRKICGRTGELVSKTGAMWSFRSDGLKDTASVKASEFDVIEAAPDKPAAPAPIKTKAKASKPAKKAAKGKGKAKEIDQGELELDNGIKLAAQPAWPFPTASKAAAGATA